MQRDTGIVTISKKNLGRFVCAMGMVVVLLSDPALAKSGGDNPAVGNPPKTIYAIEWNYFGIIASRPDTPEGEWVIGDRTFFADTRTKLKQAAGPLTIGSCVKVQVRNDRVREIRSEPWNHCPESH